MELGRTQSQLVGLGVSLEGLGGSWGDGKKAVELRFNELKKQTDKGSRGDRVKRTWQSNFDSHSARRNKHHHTKAGRDLYIMFLINPVKIKKAPNSGVIKNGTDRYVLIFYTNPVKESQLLRF